MFDNSIEHWTYFTLTKIMYILLTLTDFRLIGMSSVSIMLLKSINNINNFMVGNN